MNQKLDFTLDATGQLELDLSMPPPWINGLVIRLPGGQNFTYRFDEAVLVAPLLPVRELIHKFVTYLDLNEDLGHHTLRDYRQRLGQFAAWLDTHPGQPFSQDDTWLAYYACLKRRQPAYSPFTLKGHYHILNRFGRWLAERKYLPANPLAEVQMPGVPKGLEPKAITTEHIDRMLKVACTPRDRALLLFFRDTGCRADEAVQLTWGKLRLKERKTEVLGKGDKARRLFFKPLTRRALEEYQATLPRSEPSDPVWWGKRGQLSYDGLYKLFKRLAEKAGVEEGVINPHSWRHAFGRDTTIKGIPTAQLQELMGHNDISTTKVYAVFNTQELQQAHDRYSPVNGDLSLSLPKDLTDEENRVK